LSPTGREPARAAVAAAQPYDVHRHRYLCTAIERAPVARDSADRFAPAKGDKRASFAEMHALGAELRDGSS
jgi:hypothetical protein